jgi:DNA polymerase
MYGVPIEKIVKGQPEYELRQKGKVAELALGFQGSVGAMRAMDAGGQLADLSDDEVREIVNRWREANRRIRDLWYAMENAAVKVVTEGGSVGVGRVIISREFDYNSGLDYMTILLPSGRKLYYVSPTIGMNQWGKPSISYMGMEQQTKRWGTVETYGGKLVENCVQAIARDCLACAVERLDAAGLPIVFHVHDEIVIEIAHDAADLGAVVKIMSEPMPWAVDLPLGADGWTGEFYRKE